MQRPAHIADHFALGGVADDTCERRRIKVHRGLPLQEGGVGLALAEAGDARRACGHHVLQKLQGGNASFVVETRFPLIVKHAAAHRVQVQQPRVHALVSSLPARGEGAHARLVFEHFQRLAEVFIGLRYFEVELGKHVAPIRQHRGLSAIGQAVQLCAGACQIAFGAAHHPEIFQVDRDDVFHVIGRVGQRRVGEERLQRLHQVFGNVLALPHHDVAGQVVVALRFGHLQQLLFFQSTNGQFVHFDLDTGLFGELRQQFGHRVVMRMRGDVDGDAFARVLGIAVLCDGTADGQARTKHGNTSAFNEGSTV